MMMRKGRIKKSVEMKREDPLVYMGDKDGFIFFVKELRWTWSRIQVVVAGIRKKVLCWIVPFVLAPSEF
jgi:predicted transcriptional regulator